MGINEVQELVNNVMSVGSQGSMHYLLDKISREEQENDTKQSLKFLDSVEVSTINWFICYPYGAHNGSTISLVESSDASPRVTTEARVANLRSDNSFKLPWLETNYFLE